VLLFYPEGFQTSFRVRERLQESIAVLQKPANLVHDDRWCDGIFSNRTPENLDYRRREKPTPADLF
jgi:hypothetical protein